MRTRSIVAEQSAFHEPTLNSPYAPPSSIHLQQVLEMQWKKSRDALRAQFEKENEQAQIMATQAANPWTQRLPNELLYAILSLLDTRTLVSVTRVCKSWSRYALNEPRLWHTSRLAGYKRKINNKSLSGMIERSQRFLRVLDISGCTGVSDAGLKALVRHRSLHLQELALASTTNISFGCLVDVLSQLSRLQAGTVARGLSVVNIASTAVTDRYVRELLANVPTLTSLDISQCANLTSRVFAGISVTNPIGRLKNLKMHGSQTFTDSTLADMSTLFASSLECIDVSSCRLVSRDTILSLAKCRNLVDINLSSIIGASVSTFTFADVILSLSDAIGSNLHTFRYGTTNGFVDTCLEYLAEFSPKLVHLDLSSAIQLTDQSVSLLATCCPMLETLILPNCPLLSDISAIEVSLKCGKLTYLDMSGANLTDAGLMAFSKLSVLEQLNLNGCTLLTSKAALEFAKAFARGDRQFLRVLQLNYCSKIKNEVVDAMRRLLPGCTIQSRLC
jgi:hypothetical protein